MSVIAERWRGQTALVTGASSGIGRAFALALAAGGCRLVLTARRVDALEELRAHIVREHGVRVEIIPADLGMPEGASRLVDAIDAAGSQVDVLVNNAGIGLSGAYAETAWSRDREMAQLNMLSVLELTKRLLPPMLARRRGHVLFISSVVGSMPVPYLAHYAATKAFVRNFGNALAQELRGSGVDVTVVSPGTTATGFFARAGYGTTVIGEGPLVASAEDVVDAALRAAAEGEREVTPGFANRVMAVSGRLLPTGLVMRLAEKIQKSRM